MPSPLDFSAPIVPKASSSAKRSPLDFSEPPAPVNPLQPSSAETTLSLIEKDMGRSFSDEERKKYLKQLATTGTVDVQVAAPVSTTPSTPVLPTPPPTKEVGVLASIGRMAAQAEYEAIKPLYMIPVLPNVLADALKGVITGSNDHELRDAYFKTVVDPQYEMIERLKIDAAKEKQGDVAYIAGRVAGMVPTVANMFATGSPGSKAVEGFGKLGNYILGKVATSARMSPASMIPAGVNTYENAIKAGESQSTAAKEGVLAAGENVLANAIPLGGNKGGAVAVAAKGGAGMMAANNLLALLHGDGLQSWQDNTADLIAGGGMSHIARAVQAGSEVAATKKANLESIISAKSAANKARDISNLDNALNDQRVVTEKAKQDAFNTAEQQATDKKLLEEEAGFRTIDRQETARRLAKNPNVRVRPTTPITPEEVQAERQQKETAEASRVAMEAKAESDRTSSAELAELTDLVKQRQESVAKKTEAARVKAEKKAKAEEEKTRREVTDQLITDNPSLTPQELAPILKERLATPTTEDTATAVAPKPVKAPTGVQEVIATPTPKPATKVDRQLTDADIREMAKSMGIDTKAADTSLDMKAEGITATPKEPFTERLHTTLKALAKRNTQETADVQNLILQKKLVIAPTAEAIGRNDLGAASFDPATGRMHVYLDKLDSKNVVGHLLEAAAAHEPVHAGQYNPRDGRSAIMSQIMGKDLGGKVGDAIVAGYNAGNTLAVKAVDMAVAAGAADGNNLSRTKLEVLPYFAQLALRARENRKGFGRMGGVVKDIESAGRAFLRDKLGASLDVTLEDIAYAARGVAGEITRTDVIPQTGQSQLDMIVGKGGPRFDKAKEEGRTYVGKLDGGERAEISDADAKIIDNPAVKGRLVRGEKISLPDLLDHKILYDEVASTKDITVSINPALEGTATDATYINGEIKVKPSLVANNDALISKLLHEAQHHVQEEAGFIYGSNPDYFMSIPAIREKRAADAEYERVLKEFEIGKAERTLPPQVKSEWQQVVTTRRSQTPAARAEVFLEGGYNTLSTDRAIARYGDRYKRAVDRRNQAYKDYYAAERQAFDIYKRDYGEVESRNTEFRRKFTDDERMAQPPESTMTEVGTPVDRTLESTKFVGKPSLAPKSATLSSVDPQTKTPEFKRWFGNSKVVDADGKPLVVYHGTNANFDVFDTTRGSTPGAWFTADQAAASGFGRPMAVMLRIRNPASLKDLADARVEAAARFNVMEQHAEFNEAVINALEKRGFDGIYDPSFAGAGGDGGGVWAALRPEQIKSAIGNRGTFSETSPSILDMAAETKPTNKVPMENISDSEKLRRIIDHSVRAQTADVKLAENDYTKYRDAISKDMKGREDYAEFNKEITSLLTAVENADPVTRAPLWEEFSNKYPNLAPVLEAQRGAIDKSSDALVSKLLNSGRILSSKEIKDVGAILANRTKYLTRAYAAFQQQSGRKWAATRWSDYQGQQTWAEFAEKYPSLAIISKVGQYIKDKRGVSEKAQKNIDAVTAGVEAIQKKLVIPEDSVLQDLSLEKLESLYEDHGGTLARLNYDRANPDTLTARKDQLIIELNQQRDRLPPEHYKNLAEQVAKEMLGLSEKTSNYSRVLSDLARDPGTLKKRDVIPEAIRNMLGEITDSGARMLATRSANAALNARAGVLYDLITEQSGTLVLKGSAINQPGMRKKFPIPLKGEQFGPLDGYYATKATARALIDTVDTYYTYGEAIRALDKPRILIDKVVGDVFSKVVSPITRFEKIRGVVVKPYSWARNGLGSPLNLLRSGNMSAAAASKGLKAAKDYISGTMHNTTSELLDDALRHVNVEAVDVAEMQRVAGNMIQQHLDGDLSAEQVRAFIDNKLSKKEVAHRAGRTGLAGYAMDDGWVKLANFYDRVNVMSRYWKLEDPTRTIEQIKREAGDVTSYTNLSNERVPAILKYGEQKGVTKFMPYFSETMRTTWTNWNQAMLDLGMAARTTNPEAAAILRSHAAKRFIGNTLASVAMPARFPAMASALASAAGISGFSLVAGEEDSEIKRRMISEFNRYQDVLQFGNDKNGNPVYMAASQSFDPNGPATDPIRILVNTPDHQEAFDALKSYLGNLVLSPSWMRHVWQSATQDTVPQAVLAAHFPAATEAAANFVENIGVSQTALNKALYSLDTIVAGWPIPNKKYLVQYDEKTKDEYKPIVQFMEAMGASFETLDAQKTLATYGFEAKELKTANRSKLADNLLLPSKLDDNALMQAIQTYRVAEIERYDESRKNVDSLRAWKYKDSKIQTMLVEAGYSKAEAMNLINGNDITILSLPSLKQSKAAKGSEEKLKSVLKLINKNRNELRKIGIDVRRT